MQSWLQKWQIIFCMTACILYRLVLMFCLWYALKTKKWELLKLLLHMLRVTSKHSGNILINCLLCFADFHARTLWTRANPGSHRYTAATKLLPCCWTCCKRQANYALSSVNNSALLASPFLCIFFHTRRCSEVLGDAECGLWTKMYYKNLDF